MVDPAQPIVMAQAQVPAHIRVRVVLQVMLSCVFAFFLPFVAYAALATDGLDVSLPVLIMVAAALMITSALLTVQAVSALRSEQLAPYVRLNPSQLSSVLFILPVLPPASWLHELGREQRKLQLPQVNTNRRLDRFATLYWRPAYVWIAPQVLPLVAFWIWRYHLVHWSGRVVVVIALVSLYLLHAAPIQTVFTDAVSPGAMRGRTSRLLLHLIGSICFYSGLRNTIARTAQVQLILGDLEPIQISRRIAGTRSRPSVAPMTGVTTDAIPDNPQVSTKSLPEAVPRDNTSELRGHEHLPDTPAGSSNGSELRNVAQTAAQELSEMIRALVQQRSELAAERASLATRIQSLERTLDAGRVVTFRLQSALETPLTTAELATLHGLLHSLSINPENLVALLEISRQARELAQVVHAYASIHDAMVEP